MKQIKTVCVIGLPTAALLANRGYSVHVVQSTKEVIDFCGVTN